MEIKSTQNYGQFKRYPRNRSVSPGRLVDEIRSNNHLSSHPIVVNEDMYIIDGQHRLEAARYLGLPIYYLVCAGLKEEDIPVCQNLTPWNLYDWLHFHKENAHYNLLWIICEKWPVYKQRINQLLTFFGATSNTNQTRDYRAGKFRLKHPPEKCLKMFQDYLECMEVCIKLSGEKLLIRSFGLALFNLIEKDDFEVEEFIRKARLRPSYIKDASAYRKILHVQEMLEKMYYLGKRYKDENAVE